MSFDTTYKIDHIPELQNRIGLHINDGSGTPGVVAVGSNRLVMNLDTPTSVEIDTCALADINLAPGINTVTVMCDAAAEDPWWKFRTCGSNAQVCVHPCVPSPSFPMDLPSSLASAIEPEVPLISSATHSYGNMHTKCRRL